MTEGPPRQAKDLNAHWSDGSLGVRDPQRYGDRVAPKQRKAPTERKSKAAPFVGIGKRIRKAITK